MQSGEEGRTIGRVEAVVVECFKCGEKGHKYRECLLWRKKERAVERVACVARPQAEEHCGKRVPEEACLLELG